MDKTSELYNDFSHLGRLEGVSYKIDDKGTQFLEIMHPDKFKITLAVPDGIFEWFIDISDTRGKKIVTDWNDGYGEPKDVLKLERQKAVEDFVEDLLAHPLRHIVEKKGSSETTSIQIFKGNLWIQLIPW